MLKCTEVAGKPQRNYIKFTIKRLPSGQLSFDSLLRRRANARNVSYKSNPTGEKHTIPTFVDQTVFSLLNYAEKKQAFFQN